MANLVYNVAKERFAAGNLDWDADTIKVMLVNSSYAVDADHNTVSQVTNELAGTGYVRKTLANKVVTKNTTLDRAELDADDVTWTGISAGTAAAAIVYEDLGGADSGNYLIGFVDIADTVTNGSDFTIQWSSAGILTLT